MIIISKIIYKKSIQSYISLDNISLTIDLISNCELLSFS